MLVQQFKRINELKIKETATERIEEKDKEIFLFGVFRSFFKEIEKNENNAQNSSVV